MSLIDLHIFSIVEVLVNSEEVFMHCKEVSLSIYIYTERQTQPERERERERARERDRGLYMCRRAYDGYSLQVIQDS